MNSEKQIRVGLIRCDTHGVYFGALMEKHDPEILRNPVTDNSKTKYSWQKGAIYFYFYLDCYDKAKMTTPIVPGFNITKIWDEDKKAAQDFSNVFYGKPAVCDTFEEVSDDVDLVFVSDCNGEGTDHLELALPGIKKGVPTFIDKPFAYTISDAKALVKLAEENNTPIMSSSILREISLSQKFKLRYVEIGNVEFGIVRGCNKHLAGLIHAISLAQGAFGSGVERVEAMGEDPQIFIHLSYKQAENMPSKGVMINCDNGARNHGAHNVSAYGPLGDIHSPQIGDFIYPEGTTNILVKLKEMVATGKPQVPYSDMIENIAIAEASRISLKEKRPVYLSELLD